MSGSRKFSIGHHGQCLPKSKPLNHDECDAILSPCFTCLARPALRLRRALWLYSSHSSQGRACQGCIKDWTRVDCRSFTLLYMILAQEDIYCILFSPCFFSQAICGCVAATMRVLSVSCSYHIAANKMLHVSSRRRATPFIILLRFYLFGDHDQASEDGQMCRWLCCIAWQSWFGNFAGSITMHLPKARSCLHKLQAFGAFESNI